jgi:hypothetical protein
VEQCKFDLNTKEAVQAFCEAHATTLVGFVHSAGVLRDGMLFQLDWDKFDEVWQPKNRAALYLHEAFEKVGCPLSFYWMFSSTSTYGNMGQLNYSASNAHLDAIARHRRSLGKPALTIQWGAWGEVGMAANLDENSKKRMAASPMPSFANWMGLKGLEGLISTNVAYGAVYQVNAEYLYGMTNSLYEGKNGQYTRNFYGDLAPPVVRPDYVKNPEYVYGVYKDLMFSHDADPRQGKIYKFYVQPIVDPLGDDED